MGYSEIVINGQSASTVDGRQILGTASFKHTFSREPVGKLLSAEKVAAWNLFASLSAIVQRRDSDEFFLTSRLTLYAGDETSWWHVHAPLICTEAYMQPTAILLAAEGDAPDPSQFGLSDGDAVPPYNEMDFLAAREFCRDRGLDATSSAEGLTVEFPWDRGAVSSLFGKTFLCQLSATERHPSVGRGILCRLQTPVGFSDPKLLVDAVSELNRWAAEATDMPPFYGAWHMEPGQQSPAFVMFLPNELCLPNLPRTVAAWM